MQTIQAALKAIRSSTSPVLTQLALSQRLGVSQSLVGKWECRGPADRVPTVSEVRQFCVACKATRAQELAAYHALADDSSEAAGLAAVIKQLRTKNPAAELRAWRTYHTAGVDLRASA